MCRRAERSNGRLRPEDLEATAVYSRVKRSSSFVRRSKPPAPPTWIPIVRGLLGLAFSSWMIWTILDADKLKPFDLFLRFAVAAVALAGAIVLGKRYPEAKATGRLERQR